MADFDAQVSASSVGAMKGFSGRKGLWGMTAGISNFAGGILSCSC